MTHLVPLERLALPADLDGSTGRNRAMGGQLAARDDPSAVLAWLARYADSPATLASYRKEAERLLLWCTLQRGVALSSLTHEDLLLYQRFLADPQPAARWVMAPGQKAARHSPGWRPFAGPLSASSQRQALSILNALFSWLVEAGYLHGNPLALARRRRARRAPAVERYLSVDLWAEVMATTDALPAASQRDRLNAARDRWLLSLLYLGGLRISEIVGATMGSFFGRRGADGRERWWLQVSGKGGKARLVPATDDLLAELCLYRAARGLAPMPMPGDDTPVLASIVGPLRPMARSALHERIKQVMRGCAAALRARGPGHEAAAAHVAQASAHWIRHTAGSHLSGQIDLKMVRDNLGHANISTTSIYLHSEDDARHDATAAAHRAGWRGG